MKNSKTIPQNDTYDACQIHDLVSSICDDVSELTRQLTVTGTTPSIQSLKQLYEHIGAFSVAVKTMLNEYHKVQHQGKLVSQELALRISECDQLRIEVSALRTKLAASENKATALETKHRRSKAKLDSMTQQLDMTFGS